MNIALDVDETNFLTRAIILAIGYLVAVIYLVLGGLLYLAWWVTRPPAPSPAPRRRIPNTATKGIPTL